MMTRRQAETDALIAETERVKAQLLELSARLDEFVRAVQETIHQHEEEDDDPDA